MNFDWILKGYLFIVSNDHAQLLHTFSEIVFRSSSLFQKPNEIRVAVRRRYVLDFFFEFSIRLVHPYKSFAVDVYPTMDDTVTSKHKSRPCLNKEKYSNPTSAEGYTPDFTEGARRYRYP